MRPVPRRSSSTDRNGARGARAAPRGGAAAAAHERPASPPPAAGLMMTRGTPGLIVWETVEQRDLSTVNGRGESLTGATQNHAGRVAAETGCVHHHRLDLTRIRVEEYRIGKREGYLMVEHQDGQLQAQSARRPQGMADLPFVGQEIG